MATQSTRLVILIVLYVLLNTPANAQDEVVFEGSPTDFLPLQVGNQWTYKQHYLNNLYNRFEIVEGVVRQYAGWGPRAEYDLASWRSIREVWEIPGYPLTDRYEPESPLFDLLTYGYVTRELTLEITHTETIEGHAYFVFSKPSDWPPVPTLFLAGQKVRFSDAGVLLVRQQEQDIPLYDFARPYMPFNGLDYVTKDYTTPPYPVLYDHFLVSSPLSIRRLLLFDLAFVSFFRVQNFSKVYFLANYGLFKYEITDFFDPGDLPSCENTFYPVSAVIDGQPIEAPSGLRLGYTHVQPTSWGQLKARHRP